MVCLCVCVVVRVGLVCGDSNHRDLIVFIVYISNIKRMRKADYGGVGGK